MAFQLQPTSSSQLLLLLGYLPVVRSKCTFFRDRSLINGKREAPLTVVGVLAVMVGGWMKVEKDDARVSEGLS